MGILNGTLCGALAAAVFVFATALPKTDSIQDEKPTSKPSQEEPKDALAATAFMAGVWEGKTGGASILEVWSRAAGDSCLGTSQMYRGNSTLFREFSAISRTKTGLKLEMRHGLGDESDFYEWPGSVDEEGRLVFENKAYEGERARRIVYRKVSDDRMEVDLVHHHGDEDSVITFKFTRAKSSSTPR